MTVLVFGSERKLSSKQATDLLLTISLIDRHHHLPPSCRPNSSSAFLISIFLFSLLLSYFNSFLTRTYLAQPPRPNSTLNKHRYTYSPKHRHLSIAHSHVKRLRPLKCSQPGCRRHRYAPGLYAALLVCSRTCLLSTLTEKDCAGYPEPFVAECFSTN